MAHTLEYIKNSSSQFEVINISRKCSQIKLVLLRTIASLFCILDTLPTNVELSFYHFHNYIYQYYLSASDWTSGILVCPVQSIQIVTCSLCWRWKYAPSFWWKGSFMISSKAAILDDDDDGWLLFTLSFIPIHLVLVVKELMYI